MKLAILGMVVLAAACKKDDAPASQQKPVEQKPTPPQTPAVPPQVTIAETFLTHVAKGEMDAAVAMYDPAVTVKPEELTKIWKDIGATGEPTKMVSTLEPATPDFVRVDAFYPNGALATETFKIKDGHLRGWISKPIYNPPAYADPAASTVKVVTVGSGKTALYGELLLPKTGTAPYPVVLMIQGSGPSDLDEWGAGEGVMIFRDLAQGLAAQGIAVLRFDKATFAPNWIASGADVATYTTQGEYLDPVTWALALLAKTPEVDPKRTFLLGHSEGGWLMPWFLKDHPEVTGGIIASGNARDFADLIVDQDQYLMKVKYPQITAEQLAQLRKFDEAARDKAKDPLLADDTDPKQLPLGIPAASWKFIQGYHAATEIAKIDKPFLLIQGERDYNVTMEDHQMFMKALAGKKDITEKVYPDLNHAYLKGTGMGTPDEITKPDHAAQVVVDDIAAWVKAH